jgi:hypothetical protein
MSSRKVAFYCIPRMGQKDLGLVKRVTKVDQNRIYTPNMNV